MRPITIVRMLMAAIAVSFLLAPGGIYAKPKQISNGCTAEQIQSQQAAQCIDKMQDDILHNRPTYHALWCAVSGNMYCCSYGADGNALDQSCENVSTRVNPLELTPLFPKGAPEIAPPPGPTSHTPDKQGVDGVNQIRSGDQTSVAPLFIRPMAVSPTEGKVKNACTRMKGIFGSNESGFACTKTNCDGIGGNCTVACVSQKCVAATPSRITHPVSLIGILQNGNNSVPDDQNIDETNDKKEAKSPIILY